MQIFRVFCRFRSIEILTQYKGHIRYDILFKQHLHFLEPIFLHLSRRVLRDMQLIVSKNRKRCLFTSVFVLIVRTDP